MTIASLGSASEPSLQLTLTVLTRYLFFLSRRPISSSNVHYLAGRLAGLKGLSRVLRRIGAPAEADALDGLTPWNFSHRAPRLLDRLTEMVVVEPAADFVQSSMPPDRVLEQCGRIVVIFGPAIGIGDEILASRVVSTLSRLFPGHVEVASGYRGLWDGLWTGVARCYTDYAGFLREVAGNVRSPVDLLVLVDFEKPALVEAMSRQPGVRRYVEIALGARSVAVVDAGNRWVHRYAIPEPYFENYYSCIDHLSEWAFGARPSEPAPAVSPPPGELGDRTSIFVSPFTSKYEPDGREWSAMLATALGSLRELIQTAFDSGPSEGTARFAARLERATQLAIGGMASRVARSTDGNPLDLADVVVEIAAADVVICADSFAAHLAPRLGKPTLVLAAAGLSRWKVPGGPAFYYEQQGRPKSTGRALQLVLEQLVRPDASSEGLEPLLMPKAEAVWRRGRRLASLLSDTVSAPHLSYEGDDLGELSSAYDDLGIAHRSLLLDSAIWSQALALLAGDCRQERCLLPATRLVRRGPLASEAVRHVRDQYERWSTTNLAKLVDLLHRPAVAEKAPS